MKQTNGTEILSGKKNQLQTILKKISKWHSMSLNMYHVNYTHIHMHKHTHEWIKMKLWFTTTVLNEINLSELYSYGPYCDLKDFGFHIKVWLKLKQVGCNSLMKFVH